MNHPTPRRRRLSVLTWILQVLTSLIFIGGGLYKLVTPYAEVVQQFGAIPQGLLVTASIFEITGGLGVLLPTLTRVLPAVTVPAALGCALLQSTAVVFHVVDGSTGDLALNIGLIALALSVAWLRWRVVAIQPRNSATANGPRSSTCP